LWRIDAGRGLAARLTRLLAQPAVASLEAYRENSGNPLTGPASLVSSESMKRE